MIIIKTILHMKLIFMFYILDTQNHQISEKTKYDNEENAVVTTASYTEDMNTAIDFTFDFGEGGSYLMHA